MKLQDLSNRETTKVTYGSFISLLDQAEVVMVRIRYGAGSYDWCMHSITNGEAMMLLVNSGKSLIFVYRGMAPMTLVIGDIKG